MLAEAVFEKRHQDWHNESRIVLASNISLGTVLCQKCLVVQMYFWKYRLGTNEGGLRLEMSRLNRLADTLSLYEVVVGRVIADRWCSA